MISRSELNPNAYPLNLSQEANLTRLLVTMNKVRSEYGLSMIVTSGFRSAEDERRIDPAHPESLHTRGAACDIYDPDPQKRLWNWCVDNMSFLVEVGIWLEDRLYSPSHVHFQIYPPASGKRIFIP